MTPQFPVRKHSSFPQPLSLQNGYWHFGLSLQIPSHHQFSLPSLQTPVHPTGTNDILAVAAGFTRPQKKISLLKLILEKFSECIDGGLLGFTYLKTSH